MSVYRARPWWCTWTVYDGSLDGAPGKYRGIAARTSDLLRWMTPSIKVSCRSLPQHTLLVLRTSGVVRRKEIVNGRRQIACFLAWSGVRMAKTCVTFAHLRMGWGLCARHAAFQRNSLDKLALPMCRSIRQTSFWMLEQGELPDELGVRRLVTVGGHWQERKFDAD